PSQPGSLSSGGSAYASSLRLSIDGRDVCAVRTWWRFFMRQIASLTVTRARWSTFGHGPRLRQQERRGSGSGTGLALRAWRAFPFPPHGRIPNFAGAEVAAARLLDIEPWKSAIAIKVNPDS